MHIPDRAILGTPMALVALAVLTLALTGGAFAQTDKPGGGQAVSEQQFMREVTANELAAEKQDSSLWRYKQLKTEDGKATLREVVETDQGSLYRVIAIDGQTLPSNQAHKEDERIHKLLSNPGELQEQHEKAQHDSQMERRLLQMIPNAFLYHYAGSEGSLTKLDFTPNPSFHPSSREGQVFHHMVGSIWVDARQKRIARIDGHLASEVKFGGGILGHLAAGGTFLIEQQDVGEGHWELTRLNINVNGRALFFKTINVHQKEQDSDFKPVRAGTTVEDAAQALNQVKQLSTSSGGEPQRCCG
jgi:hypothetical protein